MFGFIDFNNQTNIVVRYAINFFNGAYICQEVNQLNIPTDGIDSSTFITVNGSLDKFGGSFVKYAPLSTITDTETGNIGVFSENFIFRRAINGDPTAVNYAKYVWNMTNVKWTNSSTIPQWYYNVFRQKGNLLLTNAVVKAKKEI
jgi:hypothetical protein